MAVHDWNPPLATTGEPSAQDRTIRVLLALVEDLTIERDEDRLLHSTLDHVVAALGLSAGATYVIGPDDTLTLGAESIPGIGEDARMRELAEGVFNRDRPTVQEAEEGGWLAATPLVAASRIIGAIVVEDLRPESYPPDLELLEAIGKQVGNGLENARLYAELRASSHRVELLNRITTSLASGQTLAEIVPAFARELQDLQAFDRMACGFVNESGDYLEVAGHPEGTAWGLGSVIPVVGSGPGFVVLNNKFVLQADLVHAHRFIEDMRLLEEGIRSYVILPLNARGHSVGFLALGSESEHAFDEGTLARMQPLANSVALAFENVRLLQRTRELSITDEVTPLYNFRYFHQLLDRELKLSERYRAPLSLIFIDLDRFKPINDLYGHLRGSRTLREVGFLIRAAVRETDYPARYGGDEFTVICPQTDGPAARVLAEKLRRHRRGARLPAGGGHRRPAGRLSRCRDLSDGRETQGGPHQARGPAHVPRQGGEEERSMRRRLLLLSNSTNHGSGYLDHAMDAIRVHLGAVRRLLFVPFALKDRQAYTARVRERFVSEGVTVEGLEPRAEELRLLETAEAVFVGGGNTFRLLDLLQRSGFMETLRERTLSGMPYLGASAGTNIAAPTIRTTNDMPVVEPESLDALGLVPFQINPHYLDPDPGSTHMGETREQRLLEYLEENERPVIGLREGAWLRVVGPEALVEGPRSARIFRRGKEPVEVQPGTDVSALIALD